MVTDRGATTRWPSAYCGAHAVSQRWKTLIGEDVSLFSFSHRLPEAEAKSKAAEHYICTILIATKELPAHRGGRYSGVFFVPVRQNQYVSISSLLRNERYSSVHLLSIIQLGHANERPSLSACTCGCYRIVRPTCPCKVVVKTFSQRFGTVMPATYHQEH